MSVRLKDMMIAFYILAVAPAFAALLWLMARNTAIGSEGVVTKVLPEGLSLARRESAYLQEVA